MSKTAASPFQEVALYAGAPTPTRAQGIMVTSAGTAFAYPSGNAVIVRDLEDPAKGLVCSLHNAPVSVARISPSGALVASGDRDGNLIVWVNRPDLLEKYKTKALGGAIRDIAWSDDSERIVVVGEGKGSYAAVMTLSGNSLGTISGHSQPIIAVDFRKGRPYRIATGSQDANVNFFEGPPFKFVHSVAGHKSGVNTVRFSPNNERIATVSGSNEVILLDGKTGEKVATIATDHTGTIYSVAWSLDGSKLATASADKSVKVYDAAAGTLLWSTSLGNAVGQMQQGVLFSGDSLSAFSLNGDVVKLNLADGKVVDTWKGHQKAAVFLDFNQGLNELVSVGQDGVVLSWKNAAPNSARAVLHDGGDVIGGAARTQSGAVAIVTATDVLVVEQGSSRSVAKFSGNPTGIATLENGAIAVVQKGSLTILTSGGDKAVEEKLAGFDASSVASFQNLIAVGGEKAVRVFKFTAPASLEQVMAFTGSHTGTVTTLAFAPGGQTIASGDSSRNIFVWGTSDGKVIQDEMVYHSSRVTSLAFNGTGELRVSGSVDSAIIVWDLAKKKHITRDYAHRGGVTAVCFGPQNEVFSAGGDNCIRRWKF